jgi:predicted metal-dependent enzyme (double-stranded beta helix superfamily)
LGLSTTKEDLMLDVDDLLSSLQQARTETEPRGATRAVLERVLADPGAVADALRPTEGGITLLHHEPDLTVLHIVWAPGMSLFPHDHRMWAAIGIYTGQEDNSFFRRSAPGAATLDDCGGKEVAVGDVLLLGDDAIHAVENPLDRLTGAIHVYGGDFVEQPRSQWGPGPREERPYDMGELARRFSDANDRWRAASPHAQPDPT